MGENETVRTTHYTQLTTTPHLLVVGVSPDSVQSYLSPVRSSLSIMTGFLSEYEVGTLVDFTFLDGG